MSNLRHVELPLDVEITIKESNDPADRQSSNPNNFSVDFEVIQIRRQIIISNPEVIKDIRRVILGRTPRVSFGNIMNRANSNIIVCALGVGLHGLHVDDKFRHEVVNKLTSYIESNPRPTALNVTINLGVVLSKELAIRANLKKVMAKDMDFKDEEDKCCAICLVDMAVEEEEATVTCTPCKHVFHDQCIYRWLKKKPHCPLCRFNLAKAKPVA